MAYYNLAFQKLWGDNKTYDLAKAKKWLKLAGDAFDGPEHVRLLTLFDAEKDLTDLLEIVPSFIEEYEKSLHLDDDYDFPDALEGYANVMEMIDEISSQHYGRSETAEDYKKEFDILLSYGLIYLSMEGGRSITNDQLGFIENLVENTDVARFVSFESGDSTNLTDLQVESRINWDNCKSVLESWNEPLYNKIGIPFLEALFEINHKNISSPITLKHADIFLINIEGIFRDFCDYCALNTKNTYRA